MLDYISPALAHTDDLAPLREFAHYHREALLDAAALLGGPGGVRTAQTVLDGLATGGPANRSLQRNVDRLRALLFIEDVHDPDSVEAACFAEIDPMDPAVEEICLLADGLSDAIAACGAPVVEPASTRRRLHRRQGQAAATISARGAVVHPGRPFAAEIRRKRTMVRPSKPRRTATARAGVR